MEYGGPRTRFDYCFGLNLLAAVFIHRPRGAAGTGIPPTQVSLEDILWAFQHLSLDQTALAPLILGRKSPALRSFVYMAVAPLLYSHASMEGAKITVRILERPFSPPWGAKITLPMDNVSRGWRRRVFLSRCIAFSTMAYFEIGQDILSHRQDELEKGFALSVGDSLFVLPDVSFVPSAHFTHQPRPFADSWFRGIRDSCSLIRQEPMPRGGSNAYWVTSGSPACPFSGHQPRWCRERSTQRRGELPHMPSSTAPQMTASVRQPCISVCSSGPIPSSRPIPMAREMWKLLSLRQSSLCGMGGPGSPMSMLFWRCKTSPRYYHERLAQAKSQQQEAPRCRHPVNTTTE